MDDLRVPQCQETPKSASSQYLGDQTLNLQGQSMASCRLLTEPLLHAVELPKLLAKEDLSMEVMGAKSLVQQVL